MAGTNVSALVKFVRYKRLALGLTQRQLAERAGGSWIQSSVSIIERGEYRFPEPNRLRALSVALDVPPEQLRELSSWAKAGVILVDNPLPPSAGWSQERKELVSLAGELSEADMKTLLRIAQLMAVKGFSHDSRTARRRSKSTQ